MKHCAICLAKPMLSPPSRFGATVYKIGCRTPDCPLSCYIHEALSERDAIARWDKDQDLVRRKNVCAKCEWFNFFFGTCEYPVKSISTGVLDRCSNFERKVYVPENLVAWFKRLFK